MWRIPLRLKTSLLALLLAAVALSQTPQIESADVDRVGAHIACQCGGCKDSVSCPMSKRGCHFCVPAKAKIYKLQKAGMSDQGIIDTFKKEFGDKIYLSDPSSAFWVVPTLVLLLGACMIYLFVRRYMRPRLAVAGNAPVMDSDPTLARYREEIERETAKLD